MNGFLLIDKPLGMSSADAVAVVKRALPRGIKIGHAGTLDPLATGMLPMAIGEGTKLLRFLVDAHKEYRFSIQWGESRSTADAEGAVIASCPKRPDEAEVLQLLPHFSGWVKQRPPAYSAIKIAGKRAYQLAREGQEVELPPRDIWLESVRLIQHGRDASYFSVRCGKGTYVRSLAVDIAEALGCCGYVGELRRLAVGPWHVGDAILLEKHGDLSYKASLSLQLQEVLQPLSSVLDGVPAYEVEEAEANRLRHGQAVTCEVADDAEAVLAVSGKRLVAIVSAKQGRLHPIRIIHDV